MRSNLIPIIDFTIIFVSLSFSFFMKLGDFFTFQYFRDELTRVYIDNWRPPRKSGLTPETSETRIVYYAIIQTPLQFSELTHSSLGASNQITKYLTVQYLGCQQYEVTWIDYYRSMCVITRNNCCVCVIHCLVPLCGHPLSALFKTTLHGHSSPIHAKKPGGTHNLGPDVLDVYVDLLSNNLFFLSIY